MKRIILIFILISFATCGFIAYIFKPFIVDAFTTDAVDIANKFLEASLAADEDEAYRYLAEDTQAVVRQICPDAKVISCIDQYGRNSWGKTQNVFFNLYDPATGEVFFTVKLQNEAIVVVIKVTQENNKWVVTGWRGFVNFDLADEVFSETSTTHIFPPEK